MIISISEERRRLVLGKGIAQGALLREAFQIRHALGKAFAGHLLEVAAGRVAFGNLELRQRVRNVVDLDVAARGDIHRAAKRIGNFAKHLGHFLGGLEIELVGGKLHAMRVAHGLAGLDAQQHFLRVGICRACR